MDRKIQISAKEEPAEGQGTEKKNLDPEVLTCMNSIRVIFNSWHHCLSSDYCSLGIVSVFKNGSAGVVYNIIFIF